MLYVVPFIASALMFLFIFCAVQLGTILGPG